jgi:deoxyribonuclease (pyrimidine dimer)
MMMMMKEVRRTMTRINCIPVEELHDKHLLAEYRELPRIFKLARTGNDIPDTYRLGTGHVKFFYNKLKYLEDRQRQLISECLRRGFNITHTEVSFDCDPDLYNNWVPTEEAVVINRERIAERLLAMGVQK